jgi:ribonuclease BN (tRNA processing enzyme)
MLVTVLGSGTGIPHPERASPGFVVQVSSRTLLVDPSSGSLQRMAQHGLSFRDVNAVVFSHFHPDHCGDLLPLLFARRIEGLSTPLKLLGPPGLLDFFEGLVRLYGDWVAELREQIGFEEIMHWQGDFAGWKLQSFPVAHTEHSLGYRWTLPDGCCFCYSGDTDYCSGLIRLAKGADAALIEASHPHPLKVEGHLSGLLAGRAAAEAGVKRLILHHRYPVWDGCDLLAEVRQGGYQGPAEPARDGMKIQIGGGRRQEAGGRKREGKPRSKVQGPKSKVQSPKSKVQSPKSKVQSPENIQSA